MLNRIEIILGDITKQHNEYTTFEKVLVVCFDQKTFDCYWKAVKEFEQ